MCEEAGVAGAGRVGRGEEGEEVGQDRAPGLMIGTPRPRGPRVNSESP